MKRARRSSWVGAVITLVAGLGSPVSTSTALQPATEAPRLDARGFAYWAHPAQRAAVTRLPSEASRLVARLHYVTEGGFPEVYPVLRRFSDRAGRRWLGIAIPGRRHGRVGWVREFALSPRYREIAHGLGVTTSTVRSHLHSVYRKLEVADRAQAVLLATERGWL